MSKNILQNYNMFNQNIDGFRCPICHSDIAISNHSLICSNNHTYDISKQGYVNLLANYRPSKYDKHLFASRRIINELGFFDPLISQIVLIIEDKLSDKSLIRILDAGCGEGYHLVKMQESLKENGASVWGVGLDISKEAALKASKNYKNNIWLVADIAKLPFKAGQFDIILNILSPANYQEFSRVLLNKGIIIKVVPNQDYLMEFRKILYDKTAQNDYSNFKTIELFENNLKLIEAKNIKYPVSIGENNLEHLVCMTPLSWGTNEANLAKLLKADINEVTVDLTILVGGK
ncbi:MAG: methyltransferase domain-containing protein [Syntrophomonadaceae bacterium]|nr:methyltransferase domain-containing protein [Syntrophomonadaceae bacterium]